MRSAGLKVLRNRLSECVRLAASGEILLVTDRGRVVAELGPPAYGRALETAGPLLAEALRSGALRSPLTATADPQPRRPVAPWAELPRELDADRSER